MGYQWIKRLRTPEKRMGKKSKNGKSMKELCKMNTFLGSSPGQIYLTGASWWNKF